MDTWVMGDQLIVDQPYAGSNPVVSARKMWVRVPRCDASRGLAQMGELPDLVVCASGDAAPLSTV